MRGRKPLPNVVKLLRASRRPLNLDEPQPRTTTMQHRLHVVLPLMAAC